MNILKGSYLNFNFDVEKLFLGLLFRTVSNSFGYEWWCFSIGLIIFRLDVFIFKNNQ